MDCHESRIEAVRPSRRPLCGLLRMTNVPNAIKGSRHAEEHSVKPERV